MIKIGITIIMISLCLTACTVDDHDVEVMTAVEGITESERSTTKEIPVIPVKYIAYDSPPVQRQHEEVLTRTVEDEEKEEGTYAGSPVIWRTLNDGDFLYFYYQYNGISNNDKPILSEYAIVGKDIELACKIRVGMTGEEAEAIIPGLHHYQWESDDTTSWNVGNYPEGWCEQFPEILIAEIEDSGEMPIHLGLMMDAQGIIRAIAFCYPTAG